MTTETLRVIARHPLPIMNNKRRFIGTLTTRFALLPRVLLCKILQELEDATLGRCQEVCRIWRNCIKTELTLCTRLIPHECLHKIKRITFKKREFSSDWHYGRFVRFLGRTNINEAREAAINHQTDQVRLVLIELELSQNNLENAQELISQLNDKNYKDAARTRLVLALIKNGDYDTALEKAMKIYRHSKRFEAYLEVAEANPNGNYSEIVEKLEQERYQKHLSTPQLALFHAKCAKLFPPHDFSRAKEYARKVDSEDTLTYGEVVAIQAEVDFDAAMHELGNVPQEGMYRLIKNLIPIAAKKNPKTAHSLIDLVDNESAKVPLLLLLSKEDPSIKLEEVEKLFIKCRSQYCTRDAFDIIIKFLERGYKVPIFLEMAKKLADTSRFYYFSAKIVEFEAKINAQEAITTIERFKRHMDANDLAKSWLAVAKAQNSQIPIARNFTLVDKIRDDEAVDLMEELTDLANRFSKIKL